MKKKTAILIDGEWFRRQLQEALLGHIPQGVTAAIMYKNAVSLVAADEEIFRIFYYDCPPYEGKEKNPVDQSTVDFTQVPAYAPRIRFLKEMGTLDFVAIRMGIAKKRGWALKKSYSDNVFTGQAPQLAAADVYLNLEQKGVDMRIGIDVATLSLKRIVERIILISGDTDMIPAIKLARREGVQVILVQVCPRNPLTRSLHEDCDLLRICAATP